MLRRPHIGNQVYVQEDGDEVGASGTSGTRISSSTSREPANFVIAADRIAAVHAGKVILNHAALDVALRAAIQHAHDREEPGV